MTTAFGSIQDEADALAIQPDGKLVAAGFTLVPRGDAFGVEFALARYRQNGSLDSSFGAGGKVTTAIGSSFDFGHALALQVDRKIVVAGSSVAQLQPLRRVLALARYNPDGSLDQSFGSGGTVTTAIGLDNFGGAVAIQPDGKIVLAGDAWSGGYYEFALARYNSDGSLDQSFGSGGEVTTAIGAEHAAAEALALQADGKLVAAGLTWRDVPTDENTPSQFALARYNPNGSLDQSFGSGGMLTTAIGSAGEDEAGSLAIQPNGKILAAGVSSNGSSDDFALARYDASGSLDPSFGSGGKVTTSFGSGDDWVNGIALQRDGKIAAAGVAGHQTRIGPTPEFALARYRSDGSLDKAFGSKGKLTTSFGPDDDEASAVAIQRDGRIVVVGSSDTGQQLVFALGRYLSSPSPCRVPDVRGRPLFKAKRALVHAHCSPGRIRRGFSNTVKKGRVLSQRPAPGARRGEGTKVTLVVSTGKRTLR